MSAPPPVAVIDVLNGLLEAEQNSIFRFMGEGSPYLSRAGAEIRKPLNDMMLASQRRMSELADVIDRLGGVPAPRSIQPEEQYLAFLTLKFLLPKLADAKKLTIERYENAVSALKGSSADVIEVLNSHITEMNTELHAIQKAAAETLAKKA